MNISTIFERLGLTLDDKVALVDTASGNSLTFSELCRAVHCVGTRIDALGLPVGSKVALLGGQGVRDIEHMLCDYGVMASGRVRVPLDPSLSIAEQLAQLRDAGASTLIYSPALQDKAEALAREMSGLALLDSESATDNGPAPATGTSSPLKESPSSEALASLSYTGGSTGSPKAVMLTHGNLACVLQNAISARGMGVGDLMLNMRPVWPIAAIVVLAHLVAGGTVVVGGKFDPPKWLQLVEQYQIATTSLVPTQLLRLLNETDLRNHDLSHLRAIDIGAAAIPPSVFERVLAAFGPKIGVMYGLTEASFSCYQPPSALQCSEADRPRRMRSAGLPLFGVEIAIRSPEGMKLKANEEGEVTIRGGHITQGYWQRADATESAFRDGWFRTGDIGSLDDEGYLSITGRLKDVIRTGGKSVLPAEVEASLLLHPAVKEVAVVGLPDIEWGEVVVAAVVLHEGKVATEHELTEWCRSQLSSFKRPKRVHFVPEIPRSHYGKIQRARVVEILAARCNEGQSGPVSIRQSGGSVA